MALFPSLKVHAPKQSNHDLSKKVRTTMAPGVLYPLATIPVVSGDKIRLSIESLIKTYPALAPLMGSFKLQADIFYSPLSLYNQALHHNSALTYGNGVPDAQLPYFRFNMEGSSGSATAAVGPSSALRYLGFPVNFRDATGTTASGSKGTQLYNAVPLLMTLDVMRNYYANRQESTIPIMYGFNDKGSIARSVNLSDLDKLFSGPLTGDIGEKILNSVTRDTVSSLFLDNCNLPLNGLFSRCYLPDSKNVILSHTLASAVGNATSVSTVGNSFTIDQFNLASKLYKVYTLSQLCGNRYSEWLRAQYSVKPDMRIDMPTFIGSTSTEVVFEDVISTVAASTGLQDHSPLGSLAGRGRGYADGKTHFFTAPQPGFVQVYVSLIPRVDYYQFMHRYLLDTQLSDLFVNNLNGIGLQDVLALDINASGLFHPDMFIASYGKQPAWIHLMTSVNEVFGDFSEQKLRGWTLARPMPAVGTPPSAYIQPDLYNYAFSDTSKEAQNFLAQFAFTIYKRSNVSKRLMPTV